MRSGINHIFESDNVNKVKDLKYYDKYKLFCVLDFFSYHIIISNSEIWFNSTIHPFEIENCGKSNAHFLILFINPLANITNQRYHMIW